MVGADAALAGVVRKAAELRAFIQCANRIGAQRAEAQCRDIKYRCRIGLRAGCRRRRGYESYSGSATAVWPGGVADKLVAILIHIEQRTEGFLRRAHF